MRAIVAVDSHWGIGYKGDLLVSLPEDQKDVFKKLTLDNTIVYGRKTLFTFPGERLLPGRQNIILSRNPDFVKDGALVLHSVQEVLEYEQNHPQEEVFIIGGAEVYDSFLPFCQGAVVSKINYVFKADAFFPDLNKLGGWSMDSHSNVIHSIKGYDFTVCQYSNHNIRVV